MELDQLREENKLLKKSRVKKPRELFFKVSNRKAVSVYGLNRYPVTLYKNQWERLLDKKDELLDFIEENESSLASNIKDKDKAA